MPSSPNKLTTSIAIGLAVVAVGIIVGTILLSLSKTPVIAEDVAGSETPSLNPVEATVLSEAPPLETDEPMVEEEAPDVETAATSPMDDIPPEVQSDMVREMLGGDPEDMEVLAEITLSGRVTDKVTDEPVAGARVEVAIHEYLDLLANLPRYSEQSAVSDADGVYKVTLFQYTFQEERPLTSVSVTAEGYARSSQQISLGDGDVEQNFELGKSVSISGRIEGLEPSRLGGLKVSANPMTRDSGFVQTTTTRDDGTFKFEALHSGADYAIVLSSQSTSLRGSVRAKGGDTDVVLKVVDRRITLFGTLLDASGKPVSGGTITYGMTYHGTGSPHREPLTTTTDEEGKWEIFVESMTSNLVIARKKPAPEHSYHKVSQNFNPVFGGRTEVNMQLPPVYTIHGRVVLEDTGEGLPGMEFYFATFPAFSQTESPAAVSGRDGSYSFEMPLGASHSHFRYVAPEGYQVRGENSRNYQARAGMSVNNTLANEPINFYAAPTDEFHLRLLRSEGGDPIPGKMIQIAGTTQTTNEEGIATLQIVMEGKVRFFIQRDHEAARQFELNLDEIEPGSVHDLILSETASLAIQLHGPNPEEMKQITARIVATEASSRTLLSQRRKSFNERGYALVENIEPGHWMSVHIDIDDSLPWYNPEDIEIKLEPGEFYDTLDIELLSREMLEVVAVDTSGQPVENYRVSVQILEGNRGSHANHQINDPGGRGFIPRPEPGKRYGRINVSSRGYLPNSMTFDRDQPESPLEFVLENAIAVVLEVVDWETGEPVSDFSYSLLPRGSTTQMNTRHRGPSPVTTQVHRPGEYTAVARVGNLGSNFHKYGETEFNLNEGENSAHVTVEVFPSATIQGRVYLKDDGSPIEGAKIHLSPTTRVDAHGNIIRQSMYHMDTGQQHAFTTSDQQGMYSFKGVPVNTTQYLSVDSEGFVTINDMEVRLESGTTEETINIPMERGDRLYGRVIGPGGGPLEGATIHASIMRGGVFGGVDRGSTTTDANGNYELLMTGSPPFNVSLHYNHATYGRSIRADEGETGSNEHRLDFDLSRYIHVSGRATFNGEPWIRGGTANTMRRFEFRTDSGGYGHSTVSSNPHVEGGYALFLLPGHYNVTVSSGSGGETVERVQLAESPPYQERDFDFSTASARVLLVFPEPSDFVNGSVSVHREPQSPGQPASYRADSEDVLIPVLPVGEMKFSFKSGDQLWSGESEVVELSKGEETIVVIDVYRNPRLVRIGGWTPEVVSHDFRPIEMDVTAHADGGRSFTVIFKYESGADALSISEARLKIDGQQVAGRGQPGWAGSSHRHNAFPLQIPPNMALPDDGVYTIEAMIRAGNTMDSTGSIYLLVE